MEGIVSMKMKGFTLMEVLIVIIIIGILAVLTIPSLRDPLERSRAKNAEFNLLAIYSAQKRYFLSERVYFNSDDVEAINQNLSIKIDDSNFTYNITKSGSGYVARARRIDGKCQGVNMTILSNNSTVDKRGCPAW
jgi:type IV pilus assembly protein PilE